MFENVSPIILHQINGAAYCCLASGMEPRAFAHSAVTDYLHDACLRIAPDGAVQEFYLNETLTFFNAETGREEVGIVLPLREAQPLIGLACPDTDAAAAGAFRALQALLRAESVLRKLYRLFSYLIAAYKQGAVNEAFFPSSYVCPLVFAGGGRNRRRRSRSYRASASISTSLCYCRNRGGAPLPLSVGTSRRRTSAA